MKIALIAGGWHFPKHFYDKVKDVILPDEVSLDLYAVCHRNMTEDLHKDYIKQINQLKESPLKKLDQELYKDYADLDYLKSTGWIVDLCENKIGDYYFMNQWLDLYEDTTDYDIYIYLSDDVYLFDEWKYFIKDFYNNNLEIFEYKESWVKSNLNPNWIHIGNCCNDNLKVMRSSTGIFTSSFLREIKRFPVDNIKLTRENQNDNKWSHWDVDEWNKVQRNTQDFISSKNKEHLCFRLSPYYRISKYMIEAERGLISNQKAITNAYIKGLKQFNII